MYIADVVDNRGTLHFVETGKTAIEGDTDISSTYSKVSVGYGLWPTCIESYGSDLAIAFFEGTTDTAAEGIKQKKAKIAFWDTNSVNINKIIWCEFPDALITSLKNVDGVLYAFSGNQGQKGCRVVRFIGGYSFEQVAYLPQTYPPMPGAVDSVLNELSFGGDSGIKSGYSGAYSLDSNYSLKPGSPKCVMGFDGADRRITALEYGKSDESLQKSPLILGGQYESNLGQIVISGATYSVASWRTQAYRTASTHKIVKIRTPLTTGASFVSGEHFIIDAYIDNNDIAQEIVSYDSSSGKKKFVTRCGVVGEHNFKIQFNWNTTERTVVALPITINYESIDD